MGPKYAMYQIPKLNCLAQKASKKVLLYALRQKPNFYEIDHGLCFNHLNSSQGEELSQSKMGSGKHTSQKSKHLGMTCTARKRIPCRCCNKLEVRHLSRKVGSLKCI